MKQYCQKKYKVHSFTLIELITAMSIFSVLMLVMMRFFSESQQAWTSSNQRSMIFENAQIAMDLISRDLQSAYYEDELGSQVPFWHLSNVDTTNNAREMISFISTTPMRPNDNCTSNMCEIQYKLLYTETPTSNLAGWLMRSVTGNKNDAIADMDNEYHAATNATGKHNYANNFNVGGTGVTNVFTSDNSSSGDKSGTPHFSKVIPYVTNLSFLCFDSSNTLIPVDATGSADTEFPAMVKITLSLLDKNSWQKWIAMGGKPDKIYWDHVNNTLVDTADLQSAFRKKHERTFTKFVFLRDMGQ